MQTIFRKFTLFALIATLLVAALPLTVSYAAGATDIATPPAPGAKSDPALAAARLELAFSRQQNRVLGIGLHVENFDKQSANVQKLLDGASKKGLDVSAVQAAFDAYKAAFVSGKPIYAQAQQIVSQHTGFDAAGKVTDSEQAKATIKSLAGVLKQYRDSVGDVFKALRDAVKAFRQANPRHTSAP